jgi:hypothetical protein
MKTTFNLVLASALMLAVTVPTLSHAAYFVDQTKTWAIDTNEAKLDGEAARNSSGPSKRNGRIRHGSGFGCGFRCGRGERHRWRESRLQRITYFTATITDERGKQGEWLFALFSFLARLASAESR